MLVGQSRAIDFSTFVLLTSMIALLLLSSMAVSELGCIETTPQTDNNFEQDHACLLWYLF